MLKQRPIAYLALIAALGGLLAGGVPVSQALFVGLFAFMLMMHLGGHGGQSGHGRAAPAPKDDADAGK